MQLKEFYTINKTIAVMTPAIAIIIPRLNNFVLGLNIQNAEMAKNSNSAAYISGKTNNKVLVDDLCKRVALLSKEGSSFSV